MEKPAVCTWPFGKQSNNISHKTSWLTTVSPTTSQELSKFTATQFEPQWLYLPDIISTLDMTSIHKQLEAEAKKIFQQPTPSGDRGVIDVLYLAFADFTVQSLFATFPKGDPDVILNEKMTLTMHFAERALVFLDFFNNIQRDDSVYDSIANSRPVIWDIDDATQNFLYMSLLKFFMGHHLAHQLLHHRDDFSIDEIKARGLIPDDYTSYKMLSSCINQENRQTLLDVEADMLALKLVARSAPQEVKEQMLLTGGIYHLFLCLAELGRHTNQQSHYEYRISAIRSWIKNSTFGNDLLLYRIDDQFQGKTEFYFRIAQEFV